MAEFNGLIRNAQKNLYGDAQSSVKWLRDSIKDLQSRKKSDEQIFQKYASPKVGNMYLYVYDPKTKATLPFWDMYPLVFPIEPYSDGFLGLNLHYLPPLARQQLLVALQTVRNNDKYNESTQLNISYSILKGYSSQFYGFENCIKRYLFGHVRSGFHYVHPMDWNKAVMLPLQRWKINPNKRYASNPPY